MPDNVNTGDNLHLPGSCGAANERMERGAQSVETINAYASKIQSEIARENKLRADMERAENEASTARETLNVIDHITKSNLGVMGAAAGIKDGTEAAKKAGTSNTGIDIVEILNDGAKIAEEGNTEANIFVLQGIAKDRDIKV